eukprot:TRINITY_DN3932_c0_g1_i2.p1 TRINITY_DN3932_c0_g1~~TRINITY_DN3932_c0_g1_i2.p1  ORF type:complete len:301 (-),score=62.47 TRINITY_DN3932_c0_g1_i2:24-926(-)
MFPLSPQPDIVRSFQKDDFYLSIFKDDLQELLALILGAQSSFLQHETQAVAALCYWGLTTGMGSRTLGEEYCDILQVNGPFRSKLSIWRRLALVFLQVVPQYALANPRRFRMPQNVIDVLQGGVLVNQIERLHLAFFYLNGIYLHISKRILSVKYIFTGRPDMDRPRYTILGYLIMLQLIVTWYLSLKEKIKTLRAPQQQQQQQAGLDLQSRGYRLGGDEEKVAGDEQKDADERNPSDEEIAGTCALCLAGRSRPTVTECGHLYCWSCICSWCTEKPQCPLCRSPITLNKLICLSHYAKT